MFHPWSWCFPAGYQACGRDVPGTSGSWTLGEREHYMSLVRLRASTIRDVAGEISVPGYDRGRLQVGIVHFGAGAFHRSHQAMYIDRLMSSGQAEDWAICAVDVIEAERGKRAIFRAQDGLYTLLVKEPDGTHRAARDRVDHRVPVRARRARPGARPADRPRTRIVSLTITEGGYNFNQTTGEFDGDNPAIRRRPGVPGAVPGTVFGFVIEALRRRRAARRAAVHRDVLRQHRRATANIARAMFGAFADLRRTRARRWSGRRSRSPTRWSTGSRRSPQPTTSSSSDRGLRHRRPLAGGLRAVHAVGARRRVSRRPAGRGSAAACSW